ncbi:MAG: PQQ-binding-like beta-propeller repeat protein [Thermoplasmata archaeon]|jgi:outer membrane protein assembly factor BamB
MPAEVGGMKIIKLIIIAIILTILVFPAGILIENYHPLNGLSWPMQLGNPQLNMVSNFSGPTNFKKINSILYIFKPILNESREGYEFYNNYYYIIYRDLFISQTLTITDLDVHKLREGKSTYLNSTIKVSDLNKFLWYFTQLNKPIFSFNNWTLRLRSYEPIAYRDTIYFTGTDGYLYALSLKGDLLWEKYLAPVYFTYIFPDNDYLYLFGLNLLKSNNTYYVTGESIYKLNLNNNEIEWNTTINTMVDLVNPEININLPPSYWNDEIYLPIGYLLYFINSSNGKIDLIKSYPSIFTNYVIVANNALYGTTNDSVIKMDIKNGHIIWGYLVKYPAPCTVYKNMVVFATLYGYTYCLNAYTGQEIWELKTHLSVLGPLTVTSNQIVYEAGYTSFAVINSEKYLIALNLNNGKVIDAYVSGMSGGMDFWEMETNTIEIDPNWDLDPSYFIIMIPNNNLVLIDVFGFVGYIPAIYIWFSLTLIIWVSVISLILIRKRSIKP